MKKVFHALCIISFIYLNGFLNGMDLIDLTMDLTDIELTFPIKNDPLERVVHHVWVASAKGDIDIVLKTIAYKKKYIHREGPNNITPLWMASQNGHSDIVQALIQAKADVNKTRDDGMCPLSIAVKNGHIEVAKLLLDAQADINQADDKGYTPLIVAAIYGHRKILKLLLDAPQADILKPIISGDSVLTLAIEYDQLHIINILINAGADVNHAAENGITPLLMASVNNKIEIVNLLLKNGAIKTINAVYQSTKSPHKMNSLYAASANGYSEIVLLLLEAGADIYWKNDTGKTALQIAQNNGYTEIVQLLKYAKTTAK